MNSRKSCILIVDDDLGMRVLLETILKDTYVVYTAENIQEAHDVLKNHAVDVALLDIRLGTASGIDLLKHIKRHYDKIEVVMITAIKEIRTAVETIKLGAFDYINKEFDYDEIRLLVDKALQKRRLFGELQTLRSEISERAAYDMIVGFNRQMVEIETIINRVAKTPSSILLTGESGTGKEIIARKIHELSCSDTSPDYSPFIGFNVASIPSELIESTLFGHEKGSFTGAHKMHKGKFELANGGTLFLDEIGELRLDLQSKLLRAIQERKIERVGGETLIPVDVRIIAATHQDLLDKVQRGEFREDLYYRLNVIPIKIPPLRERLEDLPEFINLLLKRSCKKINKNITHVTPDVLDAFSSYSWPGNIRELENIIERMVALSAGETLTLDDVPLELRFTAVPAVTAETINEGNYEDFLKEATNAFERRFILSTLNKVGWNQAKASTELGVHRKTLEYKIKRLNLQKVIEQKRKELSEFNQASPENDSDDSTS